MKTTTVTRAEAEAVLAAVKTQHSSYIAAGHTPPVLVENWEGWGAGQAAWAILWEEGPFEWTYLFPHGGIEEEFGFRIAEVALPDRVWCEAYNSWSIAIYPREV
jgi:hypothetical protein